MKRVLALAFLASLFGVSACNDAGTPAPTSGSTQVTTFKATISGANEIPSIAPDTAAAGDVTIKMVVATDDSGTPKSASIDFTATFSGFAPGTALTAAHIHLGDASTNGGILVSTTIAANEVTFPNGTGTMSKTGLTLDPNLASQIIANPSGYYFNVHTAAHPGGAARGQLVKQ